MAVAYEEAAALTSEKQNEAALLIGVKLNRLLHLEGRELWKVRKPVHDNCQKASPLKG